MPITAIEWFDFYVRSGVPFVCWGGTPVLVHKTFGVQFVHFVFAEQVDVFGVDAWEYDEGGYILLAYRKELADNLDFSDFDGSRKELHKL